MDSGTTAVINYLGTGLLVPLRYALISRLELRTEVDRVLLKEKSKCSSDAFMRWEEVNLQRSRGSWNVRSGD